MALRKIFFASVAVLGCASMASGTIIDLSAQSSDETDPSVLDARLGFEVNGNTLTLTVFNDTTNPFEYSINEVYFNGDDLVDLTLDPLPGWALQNGVGADGFGTFDFALIDGEGEGDGIAAGDSLVFTFTITGDATKNTFIKNLSTLPPGDKQMTHAAKFFGGPDDDSAFGAVPAPGALALLVVAGLFARRRRRRAA